MKPKFTIITVVLNSKAELETTIKSLSNQDFRDFEYLIIDGGSTDGTETLVKNYTDIITKYVSEKDTGLYDAMNKGIKLANGEGLIFLNAGDLFCEQVLTPNIKIPSLIPVYYKNYKNNLVKLNTRFYKLGLPYCHQGIIFENKKILYDCSYKIASDYDFYLRHKYNDKLNFSKI
ncbi:glycosyltransferase, partial [Candidatus Pelagibacter ubique]|nr:glycosyltransferase [Candidatus Pelagibacter ubique]